jgi:hypothetical protein
MPTWPLLREEVDRSPYPHQALLQALLQTFSSSFLHFRLNRVTSSLRVKGPDYESLNVVVLPYAKVSDSDLRLSKLAFSESKFTILVEKSAIKLYRLENCHHLKILRSSERCVFRCGLIRVGSTLLLNLADSKRSKEKSEIK